MASFPQGSVSRDRSFAAARWYAPVGDTEGRQGASGRQGRRIELTQVGELIALRDSEQPDGPYLVFDVGEWDAFLVGVRRGEFDVADFEAQLTQR